MNAAIRGMSKEETDAKFGEIVAFADIGDFIDQPTKTYSSGMLVRLAFAVSVCIEPELLIVDEALSVGDVFFPTEMFRPDTRAPPSGRDGFLHFRDCIAVANLCERAIWLDNGSVRNTGRRMKSCVCTRSSAGPGPSGRSTSGATHALTSATVAVPTHRPIDLTNRKRFGNQEVRVAAIWLGNGNSTSAMVGEWVELIVQIVAAREVTDGARALRFAIDSVRSSVGTDSAPWGNSCRTSAPASNVSSGSVPMSSTPGDIRSMSVVAIPTTSTTPPIA